MNRDEHRHIQHAAIGDELRPAFDEATQVREARGRAHRLAGSELHIVIEGEPGTGRRTLARSLAHLREQQTGRAALLLEGTEGITDQFRATIRSQRSQRADVTLNTLDALSLTHQRELATMLRAGQVRLLAISRVPPNPADRDSGDATIRGEELEAELSSTSILLPPLRERGDDVLRWSEHFLAHAAARLGLTAPTLSASAQRALRRHRWPGNLIELDAVLNRALCLSFKQEFEGSDLGLPDSGADIDTPAFVPLAEAIEHFRADYVARALAHFGGNRTQTARALRVDVRTIFRHLEGKKRADAG